jgi:hypothetical protein
MAASGGHPHPSDADSLAPPATEMLTLWLMLKVFSSGCAAMTGVEAVSNGVMAFRDPACGNAKKTLTIIIALLFVLLLGIALLCRAYGVAATDPDGAALRERPVHADPRGNGQRLVLLRDHRIDSAGAGALGQHGVCRFSSPDAGDRLEQLFCRTSFCCAGAGCFIPGASMCWWR